MIKVLQIIVQLHAEPAAQVPVNHAIAPKHALRALVAVTSDDTTNSNCRS
jgi:hypothetical protein